MSFVQCLLCFVLNDTKPLLFSKKQNKYEVKKKTFLIISMRRPITGRHEVEMTPTQVTQSSSFCTPFRVLNLLAII